MTSVIKHYSELTTDEFHDIVALRISVFIIEQNCPYQELDGRDKHSFHLLLRDGEKTIGTLRIPERGISYPEVSIGRVVSATDRRHEKLGHQMMSDAMRFIQTQFPGSSVRISAQSHLAAFYARYGFVATGKEYEEDGIPHIEMLFNPPIS